LCHFLFARICVHLRLHDINEYHEFLPALSSRKRNRSAAGCTLPDYIGGRSGLSRVLSGDLAAPDRAHFITVVFAVERVLRELLHPDKINLASLGNQVPHLHWHVIPRFVDDAHFPDPVWVVRRRDTRKAGMDRALLIERLTLAMRERLEMNSGV
jgi:hypothetical protein